MSTEVCSFRLEIDFHLQGKGYPDMASRALLKRLSNCTPSHEEHPPPIYGLVDCDPDGLAILSTYRHGSAALSHEHELLATPSMRWLGLRSHDIFPSTSDNVSHTLLPMTVRDRRKAIRMLDWPAISIGDDECNLRNELQIMLMLNMKAEIEAMAEAEGGLAGWLETKLKH